MAVFSTSWPSLRDHLTHRLHDAWFQALACEVGHRQDFHGLTGFCWPAPVPVHHLTSLRTAVSVGSSA